MLWPGARVKAQVEAAELTGTVVRLGLGEITAYGGPAVLVQWDGITAVTWWPESEVERGER